MDNFHEATRMNIVDDLNIKFKSMFIEMDLAMHQNLNSPRVRSPQKSLDSHEEFEFSMSSMAMNDDVHEPAMEVASADKLFFRGQLLPLQQDPKLQFVQTLTCPKEEACCDKGAPPFAQHYTNLLNFQFPQDSCPLVKLEEPLKKWASEKDLLMMCDNDESFPMQCVSQVAYDPLENHAHQDSFVEFSLQDQFDLVRSCRLDNVFDLFKNDSCSSSFHSHQSSHWSYGEKDSRDSISSSRYSNGSYQDSCLQGADRKPPHISMLETKYANTNASAENQCDMGVINRNADSNRCPKHSSKPPLPPAKARKWNWKGFFNGLRKASKLWAGDEGQVPSKGDVQKRPIFTFKELPCALGEPISHQRSLGHHWEWQANSHEFVSTEESSKTGRLGLGSNASGEQQMGNIFCLRSGGRQEANFKGIAGDSGKRENGKVQGNTWSAKESWNRCVSKVKKGIRLSSASKGQQKHLYPVQMNNTSNAMLMNESEYEKDVYRGMKAKSLSSTPLAKSPVRTPEHNRNNPSDGGYGALYSMEGGTSLATSSSSSSSMKNMSKKVGFASCPASMKSSPHHSGLLAVVNKANPDLHTAIQGAIAHCKQSQASNPP